MTALLSVLDDSISTGLRAWLLSLISCEVVRGLDNRVAPLRGPGIIFTPLTDKRLSTTVEDYDYIATTTLTDSVETTIQIDCYGPDSPNWARIVALVWHSSRAVEFLAGYHIAPLYADDPIQNPFTNGEDQYEERWTTKLHLQFNPTVLLTQDFADSATVTTTAADHLN